MVKIIVAFASEEMNKRITDALEQAGFSVFRRCASAGDVRRTLGECGDGVIITSARLPGATVDELTYDFGKQAVILAVGRPEQLALCTHPDVFKLAMPFSRCELLASVRMMIKAHRMRLPGRSDEQTALIERAKQMLMDKWEMTEPQAHRYLQKHAMDTHMKLVDYAAKILQS